MSSSIDHTLKNRHSMDIMQLNVDAEEILKNNELKKGRWLLWEYGASAILNNHLDLAGKYLIPCLKFISQEKEAVNDILWISEVLMAISRISLQTGQYRDAFNRAKKAAELWTDICERVKDQYDYESGQVPDNIQPEIIEKYIDGQYSGPVTKNNLDKVTAKLPVGKKVYTKLLSI